MPYLAGTNGHGIQEQLAAAAASCHELQNFASLEMIDLIDCAIARDVESPLLWPSRPRLTNFFNVAVQAHDQSTKN